MQSCLKEVLIQLGVHFRRCHLFLIIHIASYWELSCNNASTHFQLLYELSTIVIINVAFWVIFEKEKVKIIWLLFLKCDYFLFFLYPKNDYLKQNETLPDVSLDFGRQRQIFFIIFYHFMDHKLVNSWRKWPDWSIMKLVINSSPCFDVCNMTGVFLSALFLVIRQRGWTRSSTTIKSHASFMRH